MNVRLLLGMTIVVLALAGCSGGVQVPPAPTDAARSDRERQAFVDALKPRREGKPVIAVVGLNEGTEITDFMLPHAVLQRSGIADVRPVAPRGGQVALYPALQVELTQDFASFDRAFPSGADYVIVPAMRDDDNPAVIGWLRQQAGKGARIIGICVGSLVVGQAGLLDGRHFTSHWFYRNKIMERHPSAIYVPHQRYVFDRDVVTTTGITASLPTMLALIEAIGGRDKARSVATDLGVASWTPVHDSTMFRLDAGFMVSYIANKVAFWRNEDWEVDVREGSDDIALAFAADAWSRTGHVDVQAVSDSGRVKLRSGLVLLTQKGTEGAPRLPLAPALKPVQQLDRTLCEIGLHFGTARREWVMQEMEYAGRPSASCATAALSG